MTVLILGFSGNGIRSDSRRGRGGRVGGSGVVALAHRQVAGPCALDHSKDGEKAEDEQRQEDEPGFEFR